MFMCFTNEDVHLTWQDCTQDGMLLLLVQQFAMNCLLTHGTSAADVTSRSISSHGSSGEDTHTMHNKTTTSNMFIGEPSLYKP